MKNRNDMKMQKFAIFVKKKKLKINMLKIKNIVKLVIMQVNKKVLHIAYII